MHFLKNARRAAGVTVAVVLCFAGTAWGKEPTETAASRESCVHPLIEQPFTTFGDMRDYVLAPGGSFDDPSAPGWDLDGGAAVSDGALDLPVGASATTPAMCVDLNYPTMRFLGLQKTKRDADIDVEVLYPDAEDHALEWHKAGSAQAKRADEWEPTQDVKLSPERGGKFAGGRPVALRFTNDSKKSDWRIDNVYVDPRRR
jgi:hypothetical protein